MEGVEDVPGGDVRTGAPCLHGGGDGRFGKRPQCSACTIYLRGNRGDQPPFRDQNMGRVLLGQV